MGVKSETKAQVLSGKLVAQACQELLAQRVAALPDGRGVCLAVVLVGDDPASLSYVTGKKKAAAQVGISSRLYHLSKETNQQELDQLISQLGEDESVDGILVQLPLPKTLNEERVTELIHPLKDVDCFHPQNAGALLLGRPRFLPCTPHGIWRLLQAYGITTCGAHVVIAGRSNIVGKPLAQLLLDKRLGNATVTVVHSASRDLAQMTRTADILVAAMGQPELVRGDMIKEQAVVVDVGVNRVVDHSHPRGFRLVGDVCYREAEEKAAWISPVPLGVGPMTIAMLLYNTWRAACIRRNLPYQDINWNKVLG